MQKLFDFYEQTRSKYLAQSDKVKKRMIFLSYSRVVAFILILLAIYFFRAQVLWATLGSVLGLALFLFLVRFYEDTKGTYRHLHALININSTELKVLNHDFLALPAGEEYINPQHSFSHDIDLFGQGSFYQYLNRTQLKRSSDVLATLLTSNAVDAIAAKQEAIDELALQPEWRQNFGAKASLVHKDLQIDEAISWLENYKSFVPKSMHYLPWLFLSGFVALVIATYNWSWSLNPLILWIVVGLGITARNYRNLSALSQRADKVKSIFKQHAQLLQLIEESTFEAPQLKFQKQRLLVGSKKASEAINAFSKHLNTMDYNNNIFYAIFGNGCFLGALLTAYRIEEWIQQYGEHVEEWFQVVAFMEAYCSLGNFAFNHPRYAYPELTGTPNFLQCTALGHPLIPTNKNVRNNFSIGSQDFFIITGSNMAGKSTFLRSVGLCIVMANVGLPVCAESCLYHPRKLATSMRSIDSLQRGDSYFFSELKRLKQVVQWLKQDEYFLLLDEILKGTNSHDKAIGSKRFLAKLIRMQATGLIATHDLSLCETAKDHNNVYNYHLDATISNNELTFDYLLKKGVSETMNASFLLEKMDLV